MPVLILAVMGIYILLMTINALTVDSTRLISLETRAVVFLAMTLQAITNYLFVPFLMIISLEIQFVDL